MAIEPTIASIISPIITNQE